MKKTLITIGILSSISKTALANPACIVCTVAIGTSLSIARKLGVNDNIIAIWLGAILALLGYWTILLFEKKKWNFIARDYILLLLSFSMIGAIYIKDLKYTPEVILKILYIDKFLFSAIIGWIIYVISQKLYQYMKVKNGGHAHFPFEKVVIPVLMLIITSIYFTYLKF